MAHLQTAQADTQTKVCKRATKPTHHDRPNERTNNIQTRRANR